MKILIFTLVFSSSVFAQYEGAINTLGQAGWFNSHHKAYQFGEQRQMYRAQEEEMRLHRELATEQIRASQGFQRNPVQNVTCFQTQYGVHCQ